MYTFWYYETELVDRLGLVYSSDPLRGTSTPYNIDNFRQREVYVFEVGESKQTRATYYSFPLISLFNDKPSKYAIADTGTTMSSQLPICMCVRLLRAYIYLGKCRSIYRLHVKLRMNKHSLFISALKITIPVWSISEFLQSEIPTNDLLPNVCSTHLTDMTWYDCKMCTVTNAIYFNRTFEILFEFEIWKNTPVRL